MCLTDRIFLQTPVTFCEYLVFHEFRRHLYITPAKYREQEGIAGLLFSSSLYTIFSSNEVISWDESSRLLYVISISYNSDKPQCEHIYAKFDADYTDLKKSESTNILAIEVRQYLNNNYQNYIKIFTDISVLGSLDSGAGFVIPDLKMQVFLLRVGFLDIHIWVICNIKWP